MTVFIRFKIIVVTARVVLMKELNLLRAEEEVATVHMPLEAS